MGHGTEQVVIGVLDHYDTHLDVLHLNRAEPGNTAFAEDQVAKDNWEADCESDGVPQ
jgi:choline/glycine/proline betaine transport protein